MGEIIHLHLAGHGGLRPNSSIYASAPDFNIKKPSTWYKSHYFKPHDKIVYEGVENRKLINYIMEYNKCDTNLLFRNISTKYEDTPLKERLNYIYKIYNEEKEKGNTVVLHEHHANAFDGHKQADFNGTATGYEVYSSERKNFSDTMANIWIKNMVDYFGEERNRGHKEKDFYIIYNVPCYAVLYEWYFFDNWDDYNIHVSSEGFKNMSLVMNKTMKEINENLKNQ